MDHCLLCFEKINLILSTTETTCCSKYICRKCLPINIIFPAYTSFICCNKCLYAYERIIDFYPKYMKTMTINDITVFVYIRNSARLYSFIDIFENEKQVFKNIKKKIIKQLDVHLINDLQSIVIDYIY